MEQQIRIKSAPLKWNNMAELFSQSERPVYQTIIYRNEKEMMILAKLIGYNFKLMWTPGKTQVIVDMLVVITSLASIT